MLSAVNDADPSIPREQRRQLYLCAGYEALLRSELMLQKQRRRTSGAIQKGVPTEVFLRSRVLVS